MNAEHARETGLVANSDEADNRFAILHRQLVKKTKETISQISMKLRFAYVLRATALAKNLVSSTSSSIFDRASR
jgi:hypothetical protein